MIAKKLRSLVGKERGKNPLSKHKGAGVGGGEGEGGDRAGRTGDKGPGKQHQMPKAMSHRGYSQDLGASVSEYL